MLNVRLFSDLHLELVDYKYEISSLAEDKKTVLLLAGDIGYFKHVKMVYWLESTCAKFRDVIYCAGNHEFYGSSLYNGVRTLKDKTSHIHNLHILQNQYVSVDDVAFIGSTLWTNYRNGNPIAMLDAESFMNDFKKIRIGPGGRPWLRKIRATDIVVENAQAKDYIFSTLDSIKSSYRKILVMTHHAPSYQSISECYSGGPLNDAYVNDLEHLIVEKSPDYWVHGHVHSSFDYMIENTRVLTNPRGYPSDICGRGDGENENPNFNPTLILEV